MDAQIHSLMRRLRADPEDVSCLIALRRSLLQRADYVTLSRCLHFVAHHSHSGSERADLLYEAAQTLRLDPEFDAQKRIALLHDALCQDPRHLAALEALCAADQSPKDATCLVATLSGVIERAQARELPAAHYTQILVRLAEVYALGLGQTQGALACYREILRLDPEHEEAPRQLAHLLVHGQLGPKAPLAPCPPLAEGAALDAWLERACLETNAACAAAQAVHHDPALTLPHPARTIGCTDGQSDAKNGSVGATDIARDPSMPCDQNADPKPASGPDRVSALSENNDHHPRTLPRDAAKARLASQTRPRTEYHVPPPIRAQAPAKRRR